ncbi:MAG: 50S ribosomal protein L21 [Rickettsiaceae bacterium]|nr:50S ribosomal protein L21 [Rickettsiaceae bacterium]
MSNFNKSGFAVISSSGKQYKVYEGSTLALDRISGNLGDKITFDKVLMIDHASRGCFIGTPTVEGAMVTAEIIEHKKDPKVIIFKKKRRQNYRRKNGYRHSVTQVKILEINKVKVG